MFDTTFPWFPILIGCAAGVGLYWAWWKVGEDPRRFMGFSVQSRRDSLVPGLLICLLGALLGGRISFVFLHWTPYQADPVQIMQLWDGGLDWIGVPVGITIVCLLYAGWKNLNPLQVVEDQLPIWTCLVAALWLTGGFYGQYYGSVIKETPIIPPQMDALGEYSTRVPLSILGAMATLAGNFLADWLLDHPPFWKFRLPVAIGFQFTVLLVLSFFREDPVAPIGSLPSDRLAAMVYLILSVIGLILTWIYTRKKQAGIA